jgi:hypothetical protein
MHTMVCIEETAGRRAKLRWVEDKLKGDCDGAIPKLPRRLHLPAQRTLLESPNTHGSIAKRAKRRAVRGASWHTC